jgi:hypothetical protein
MNLVAHGMEGCVVTPLLLVLTGAAWLRADVAVSEAVGQVYHTTATAL